MPRKIPVYRSPLQPTPAQARREYDQAPRRKGDLAFYNGARWRKLKRIKLASDPLCEPCRRAGRVTAATHVHHVQERHLRPDLEYDFDNLESTCLSCHNRTHAGRRRPGTG
jgi:5-methylcytosine-specific restriction enzyme A